MQRFRNSKSPLVLVVRSCLRQFVGKLGLVKELGPKQSSAARVMYFDLGRAHAFRKRPALADLGPPGAFALVRQINAGAEYKPVRPEKAPKHAAKWPRE